MNHPISETPEAQLLTPLPAPAPSSESRELMAEILVTVGQDSVSRYSIRHGEYLIGSDASCPIPIDAERVARHHARLTFSAFELVIEDLGDSGGVFIDGVQVQLPTRLNRDQEVQIGSAKLVVRLNDATARQITEALWDTDLGLAPVRAQLTEKRYKPITTVARGGMGVIMQARDLRVRRTVAMKVMKAGAQFSRENVLRFIDEAQLTGQLDHPSIVPVYELGIDDDGEAFYTMKYVKGITLEEVLRSLRHGRNEMVEKYPLGTLLTIFQKICDAVAFAHSKGVVHRDLKPENVMIGAYGEVYVMDWGLAKHVATVGRSESSVETALDNQPPPRDPLRGFETLHGVVVGTPPYVSPEQAAGALDMIDPRSDVYVLGGILYAILTLHPPIASTTLQEVIEKVMAGDIEPPLRFNRPSKAQSGPAPTGPALPHCPGGRIPEGLSAVVMKAMSTDPDDRYQSVPELQADLTAYQGGFATKAEAASLWRHALLFAARHKREVGALLLCALAFNALIVAFIVQVTEEKNRALSSEQKLTLALHELRGAAPTFAAEAVSLLEQRKPDEALEKIDYAIEQLPNDADFYTLRGNILQSLLRFDEAVTAYDDALKRNPHDKAAADNLKLTEKLISEIGPDEKPTQPVLKELQSAMISQHRSDEALGVLDELKLPHGDKLLVKTWKAAFEKRGFKELEKRFVMKDDETLDIDLSKYTPAPDLRKLSDGDPPISGLNLDDTRINDINPLKGLPLETLSLNRTQVRDLAPLAGMPLYSLSVDNTPVLNLGPLTGLPLVWLHASNTKIDNLEAVRGMELESLSVAGCRNVVDITPLQGMPLQRVDLSKTGVTDLSALAGSPIRELNLGYCSDLKDLRPLMEMLKLESVIIPERCPDIAFLRDHPTIKFLSRRNFTEPADDFWKKWDNSQTRPRGSQK